MLRSNVLSQQFTTKSQADVYASKIKFTTKYQNHVNAHNNIPFTMEHSVLHARRTNITIEHQESVRNAKMEKFIIRNQENANKS